jgi:hypothetical protein
LRRRRLALHRQDAAAGSRLVLIVVGHRGAGDLILVVVRHAVRLEHLFVLRFVDRRLGRRRLISKRARPWWHRVDAEATSIASVADEIIDTATPEKRAELAVVWQERANSELRVGASFGALTSVLIESGVDESVLEIATDAVRDELHHAQIAAGLASRYRGSAIMWPGPQHAPLPMFVPAGGALRAALLITTLCCINETLACSVLEAQMMVGKSPLAKAAYQSILADEIDHGRMGWAHLASRHVGADIRNEIGNWLPFMLEDRFRELFQPGPLPAHNCQEHGFLSRHERQLVIRDGLRDVVFPGFRHIGVDPSKGDAWLEDAFRTVV